MKYDHFCMRAQVDLTFPPLCNSKHPHASSLRRIFLQNLAPHYEKAQLNIFKNKLYNVQGSNFKIFLSYLCHLILLKNSSKGKKKCVDVSKVKQIIHTTEYLECKFTVLQVELHGRNFRFCKLLHCKIAKGRIL